MSTNAVQDAATSGLEGLVVARTELSDVDGQRGQLTIRGFDVEELAGRARFEEVAYLLWFGQLPSADELVRFQQQLASQRSLPREVLVAVELAAERLGPMDALRFAAAALSADDPAPADDSHQANLDRAIRLVARVPVIVATHHRLRSGQAPVEPRADLALATNFLYQLTGQTPGPAETRALDTYLVTISDHGMNASTFTARVIASTASDMVSAVTGAIGALKGPLHGGAPGPALEMIEAIGQADRAESWMRSAVDRGERLMGFGHRVYHAYDPRAAALRKVAEGMSGMADWLDLAVKVEDVALRVLAELKPDRILKTNVEYYAAAVLQGVGLPPDLFPSTFALARHAGWTAHCIEYAADNKLIRPDARYTGPGERPLPVG